MIPRECKRLAEVDFPIAVVSKHAAREKSIRHGHPSTLHLWWARRPLASCRAMLLALVLPDPCDRLCLEEFKTKARNLLPRVQGRPGPTDEDLRKAILKFIGDFANWDVASDRNYLEVGRGLVKAAHPDETPLVVDPFAGGGSIPLEALRLGCEAFASDLNPVACLILKVMLEDIPRHGPGLADELRRVGAEIKKAAEKELAQFYPEDPDGAKPIAYLWARTVRCESPNCGAEIPLMRSFWLCKKANRRRALRPVGSDGSDGSDGSVRSDRSVRLEIFEPKSEREVQAGTVTRARATCLCCGAVLPPERVRAQLAAQRGGADVVFGSVGSDGSIGSGRSARIGGARLLAVVTLKPGETGRQYRLPTDRDYDAVRKAQDRLATILNEWERGKRPSPSGRGQGEGFCPVPDEPLPPIGTLGFRVQRYGMLQWGDLFTARQKFALVTLARLAQQFTAEAQSTQRKDKMNEAVRAAMAFAVSKQSDFNSTLSRWANHMEKSVATFGRQALPMLWDWGEIVPMSESSGGYLVAVDWIANAVATVLRIIQGMGQIEQADANEHPLPNEAAHIWFTDPPYYDAVPYADLSDFFLVWLKRALPGHPLLRDPFDPANPLTPKTREAVQDETKKDDGRAKDRAWFEETMARAFAEGRRVLREDGVGSVVFAHKTTEGWEALLSGLIRGGWTITGSWPIATEKPDRMRAMDSAALATSVHLVCRPRPEDAPVGDWGEVLRELPRRVGNWMERLQGEGVRGADLVFACIGPSLEIFSRYSRVETAEGREVTLPEFLEKVWEVVGRTALEQVLGISEAQERNGAAGALEEDARLTALFLWTLQSSGGEEPGDPSDQSDPSDPTDLEEDDDEPAPRKASGFSLVFDVVRRFAQPLGIGLPRWEGRIIKTEKGVVRLLPISERARQLFGEEGADAVATLLERDAHRDVQQMLFSETEQERAPKARRGRRGSIVAPGELPDPSLKAEHQATTLDRVHAAMLLQASGRAHALRALIHAELDRSPAFLRLANALSALYSPGSEEKRLLDAMLLAVPR